MDNQNPSIKTTIINFGLVLGGITVVFQLMLFFLDMHYKNDSSVGIVSLVIMIGLLLYAFIHYKKSNEGRQSLTSPAGNNPQQPFPKRPLRTLLIPRHPC